MPDQSLDTRFLPIEVQGVAMSRLHTGENQAFVIAGMSDFVTVVVTSESCSNIRVCGFGSGGR
jgi:hypothetical protein